MPKERFIPFDAQTGEATSEGFLAYVAPRRRNGFTEGFFTMSMMASSIVAKNKDLKLDDYRVMHILASRLDNENFIVCSHTEMAIELAMKPSNFSRALRKLIDCGLIERSPVVSGKRGLRFNPAFVWRGSAVNHRKALSNEHRQRMKRSGIRGVIEGGAGA